MKEVLTKKFWQGVKQTFYEALEEAPPADKSAISPPLAEHNATAPSAPDTGRTSDREVHPEK